MSKVLFQYGARFQESMMSLMLRDIAFADKCCEFVPSEHLHSEAHRWLFDTIKERYDETGMIVSQVEIDEILKPIEKFKRKSIRKIVDKCFGEDPESPEFIREQLAEFAKRTNFADLFAYGQTLYNDGNHDDAYTYVLESINHLHAINFNDEETVDISEFETKRQRFITQKGLTGGGDIPTGISELDAVLQGGLSKAEGEFGCLLAEAKIGKSIGLIHMGFAGLCHSHKVVHFVLEGTTEQTMMRYQSRFTRIDYNRIKADEVTGEERVRLEAVGERYKRQLMLVPFNKHWEYTTLDIEAKLKELDRKGWSPDLVIVDYADLLHSREKHHRTDLEQRDVFRDLKSIAINRKVALWTASQAQRPKEADKNNVRLLSGSSVAESYEKIRIIDFLGTLNQTPVEKTLGVMRLHCDIYRSNKSAKTINLITGFDRMIFHNSVWKTVPTKFMRKRTTLRAKTF